MQTVYPIFAEYHFYIKKWLECLMTLPRLNTLGLKIPIVYSTPRRAFALGGSELATGDAGGAPLYSPPNQGNNWLPILAFHMSGFSPVLGKTIPYEHVLLKEVQDNNNGTARAKIKPPLVYEVTYTAALYTALMQDMDILTFKFVTEFKPNFVLWCGPPGTDGDSTKGLNAHMLLESVVDATEYEPMDIGERVVRKDFNWKITEAYVPTIESVLADNIVKEVFTDVLDL
jgi:hypothetical protein